MTNEAEEFVENFTPDQAKDSLEASVLAAYDEGRDELEQFEDIPDLRVVYDNFVADVQDTMLEIYEEFFGDSTSPRADWMYEIGVDPRGMPDILTVCKILNVFHLPYTHHGVQFNHHQRSILREPPNIEEEKLW